MKLIYGEIRSSCLHPLYSWKGSKRYPLRMTLDSVLYWNILIHLIRLSPELYYFKVLLINIHLKLLNAFWKSTNNRWPSFSRRSHSNKMSYINLEHSEIDLFDKNPFCFLLNSVSSRGFDSVSYYTWDYFISSVQQAYWSPDFLSCFWKTANDSFSLWLC